MSIKKLGPNEWLIRISVRVAGRDQPAKKQERFTGNKIAAEQRSAEIVKSLLTTGGKSSLKMNVNTFADALHLFVEKMVQCSTSHKSMIDRMSADLGHLSLDEFSDYFETYLRAYRRTLVHGMVRSNCSGNRKVAIARAVFTLLVDLDMWPKNPITNSRFPKTTEKPRDRQFSDEEFNKLLAAIKNHRPYLLPIIQYMAQVPCRTTELTIAKREQYNPSTGTIFIPDSKNDVAINKPIPAAMRRSYFDSIPADCPYLFYRIDKDGMYHPLGDFKKSFHFCLKQAGLSDFQVKDLRHRAVTTLIENGNTPHVVADIAGWKSTAMLQNYRSVNTLKSAQGIMFEKSTI